MRHGLNARFGRLWLAVMVLWGWPALVFGQTGEVSQGEFQTFLSGIRGEAVAAGVTPGTVDRALEQIVFDPRVVELSRRQPEFVRTFTQYLRAAVTTGRVIKGRRLLSAHADTLARIEADYGLPSHYVAAFWALESNYGSNQGSYDVLTSLATLAYVRGPGSIFRTQLIDALKILDGGRVPRNQLVGSWAGAMGQPQFMPSSYLAFAIDGSGDGFADIWSTEADVFASIGNYLHRNGWTPGQRWGREVRVPADFDWANADSGVTRSLEEWARLGLRNADGGALPQAEFGARLLVPSGYRGPAFLVYDNFDVILSYNRANSYALAVGYLADRIAGRPPLAASLAEEEPLRSEEVMEIQSLLNRFGYDAGPVDGLVGGRTRGAIRAFQSGNGMIPDGYHNAELLARLRSGGT